MANDIKIGIIGGSGLYQMAGLTNIEEMDVDTPFGKASDAYRIGTLEGRRHRAAALVRPPAARRDHGADPDGCAPG